MVKYLILGGGPTGLGAGWRLNELGVNDWLLLEKNSHVGGLAASFQNDGFTWDIGGHVLFSHYDYFSQLTAHLVPEWYDHQREAWIWMDNTFIPYPLQNNIWRLPQEKVVAAIDGLLELKDEKEAPTTFRQWNERMFGKSGLVDIFMEPYNRKVWAYPTTELNASWLGERVAAPDVRKIIHNTLLKKDILGWGPNALFRFPAYGGTGAIWEAMETHLHDRILKNKTVSRINVETKTVFCEDGTTYPYETLINTLPLNEVCRMTEGLDLHSYANQFKYSSTHVIGVGLSGEIPEHLKGKCWLYFPEDNAPFYRITVFSHYSPHNIPAKGTWSLMAEVSESPYKPVPSKEILIQQVIEGMKNTHLITELDEVLTTWYYRAEYGYPTPFIGRDDLLRTVLPQLKTKGIYSRGRFGGWKYEVGNMDHSTMQGVELINRFIKNEPETTYHL